MQIYMYIHIFIYIHIYMGIIKINIANPFFLQSYIVLKKKVGQRKVTSPFILSTATYYEQKTNLLIWVSKNTLKLLVTINEII